MAEGDVSAKAADVKAWHLCGHNHDCRSRRGGASTHPMAVAMALYMPVCQLVWSRVINAALYAARSSELGEIGKFVDPSLACGFPAILRHEMTQSERVDALGMEHGVWGADALAHMAPGNAAEGRLLTLLFFVSPLYEICAGMLRRIARSSGSRRGQKRGRAGQYRPADHSPLTASATEAFMTSIRGVAQTQFGSRRQSPKLVPTLAGAQHLVVYSHRGTDAAAEVNLQAELTRGSWQAVPQGQRICDDLLVATGVPFASGPRQPGVKVAGLGLYGGVSSMWAGTPGVEPLSLCLPSASCRAIGFALLASASETVRGKVAALDGVPVNSMYLAQQLWLLQGKGAHLSTLAVFITELLQFFPPTVPIPPSVSSTPTGDMHQGAATGAGATPAVAGVHGV